MDTFHARSRDAGKKAGVVGNVPVPLLRYTNALLKTGVPQVYRVFHSDTVNFIKAGKQAYKLACLCGVDMVLSSVSKTPVKGKGQRAAPVPYDQVTFRCRNDESEGGGLSTGCGAVYAKEPFDELYRKVFRFKEKGYGYMAINTCKTTGMLLNRIWYTPNTHQRNGDYGLRCGAWGCIGCKDMFLKQADAVKDHSTELSSGEVEMLSWDNLSEYRRAADRSGINGMEEILEAIRAGTSPSDWYKQLSCDAVDEEFLDDFFDIPPKKKARKSKQVTIASPPVTPPPVEAPPKKRASRRKVATVPAGEAPSALDSLKESTSTLPKKRAYHKKKAEPPATLPPPPPPPEEEEQINDLHDTDSEDGEYSSSDADE